MKTVAVLGLGYVGFPLAELLVKTKKYRVIGLDISPEKIAWAKLTLKSNLFAATQDFGKIKQADISVVCVPTPVFKNYMPDYGPVKNACLSIIKNLKPGQLIIIESTINPGTCEEVVLPILERFGAVAGKDFLLAHCPERIDPGNKKWTLINIPRNVGGIDEHSATEAAAFYRSFLKSEVKILNSIKAAEATKIVENTFRDINIAYVNELAMSFDKLGIDILEVIEGAKTKPFAFMPHYPGAGVGGHCFEKTQIVFIKTKNGIETLTFEELFRRIENATKTEKEYPEILSFDLKTQKSCFKKLLLVTKRPCDTVISLRTKYGFEIKVTDQHPVIIYRNGAMHVCLAKDIQLNDTLVINKTIPSFNSKYDINTIESIKNTSLAQKVRVGLKEKIVILDKSLRHKTFFLAPVTSTETLPTDTVYSAEVEDTHTIVTSYGIVAHNCIPVDPYYLIERALHSGFEHRFLEMARKVNNGMPEYTVSLLENEAEKLKLPLKKMTIGLLGLAYKKDIEDVRESPSLQILKILKSKRLKIEVFDPFLPQKSTVKDLKTFLQKCSAVILATNHSVFEKNLVNMLRNSKVKIFIDGRNCIPKDKVTALGIAYKGIGH